MEFTRSLGPESPCDEPRPADRHTARSLPDAVGRLGEARRPDGPPWRRYVALGDSFTEGLWDVPDGAPPVSADREPPGLVCRGWADLLATHLAERVRAADPGAPAAAGEATAADDADLGRPGDGVPFRYANLAVRGRLLGPILRDQLPAALDLRPDLVSLIGGGNDLLRPLADPDALAADLERGVVRLREAGVDVLLGTGMNSADSPVIRRSRGRVAVLNSHVWSIARRHDAYVLDVWGMRSLRDWRMWAPDRIHLTTEGHRRVAQGALVGLGLAPDDAAWDDPLVRLSPLPPAARVRSDAEWLRVHVYPWATRRLRRRSSGDRRMAKWPELHPVEVPADSAGLIGGHASGYEQLRGPDASARFSNRRT